MHPAVDVTEADQWTTELLGGPMFNGGHTDVRLLPWSRHLTAPRQGGE